MTTIERNCDTCFRDPIAPTTTYNKLMCECCEDFSEWMAKKEVVDVVNKPSHYQVWKDEQDVLRAIQHVLDGEKLVGYKAFCVGNFLKYRLRMGSKDDVMQEFEKSNKYKEFMG